MLKGFLGALALLPALSQAVVVEGNTLYLDSDAIVEITPEQAIAVDGVRYDNIDELVVDGNITVIDSASISWTTVQFSSTVTNGVLCNFDCNDLTLPIEPDPTLINWAVVVVEPSVLEVVDNTLILPDATVVDVLMIDGFVSPPLNATLTSVPLPASGTLLLSLLGVIAGLKARRVAKA